MDAYWHNNKVFEANNLEIGTTVRILQAKGKFDKEKPNYSTKLYKVLGAEGIKYILQSEAGQEEARRYKFAELLKVDKDALLERVQSGNKLRKAREANLALNTLKNKEKVVKTRVAASKAVKEAKAKENQKPIAKRLPEGRAKPPTDWWNGEPPQRPKRDRKPNPIPWYER